VTSPPYYGLRTYVPDQWLRNWFLGGPPEVVYHTRGQISHTGQDAFASDLRRVWLNAAEVAAPGACLVIRFGAISDRAVEPAFLIRKSLVDTPWRIQTRVGAGNAHHGKRQAETFQPTKKAIEEFDLWAINDA
jgi:hypothetical protein